MNNIKPIEPPKFIIEELDRMHSLISHPNSNSEMKEWGMKKIDELYTILFMVQITVKDIKTKDNNLGVL